MASPSSVLTLGLGSWGTPSLLVTLGYGSDSTAIVGLWSNVYVLQASGSYFQINAGGERINIQGTGESIDA